jgi:hypothetical protein
MQYVTLYVLHDYATILNRLMITTSFTPYIDPGIELCPGYVVR